MTLRSQFRLGSGRIARYHSGVVNMPAILLDIDRQIEQLNAESGMSQHNRKVRSYTFAPITVTDKHWLRACPGHVVHSRPPHRLPDRVAHIVVSAGVQNVLHCGGQGKRPIPHCIRSYTHAYLVAGDISVEIHQQQRIGMNPLDR